MTGVRRFEGFGEDALEFYLGLAADNSRTYWQAHRPRYEASVARPLRALASELEPDYGPFKIFRPYRDVRFSPDKRPYKEAAGMVAEGVGGGRCTSSSGWTVSWSPGATTCPPGISSTAGGACRTIRPSRVSSTRPSTAWRRTGTASVTAIPSGPPRAAGPGTTPGSP